MDRILHCNVCFKTFNDGKNKPDGALPVDPITNKVILVCHECNTKRAEQVKAAEEQVEVNALAGGELENEPIIDDATARSSKTSKS